MSGKEQPPPQQLLEKTAAVAAQQKAMERSCKLLPHGCRKNPMNGPIMLLSWFGPRVHLDRPDLDGDGKGPTWHANDPQTGRPTTVT